MGSRDVPVGLVVAVWREPAAAAEALRELRGSQVTGGLRVVDTATLVVDPVGKLRIIAGDDTGADEGAVIGGVLGAGLGLLTDGRGWLLLGGGTIGALAAQACAGGLPSDRLRALGGRLTPGSSVLVAVAEAGPAADLERELDATGGDVVRETVAGDLAARLDTGSPVVYRAAQVEGDVVAARPALAEAGGPADVGAAVVAGQRPATYEVRLHGVLSEQERRAFTGMDLRVEGGETVVRCRVSGQEDLVGVVLLAEALGRSVRGSPTTVREPEHSARPVRRRTRQLPRPPPPGG